MSFESEQAELAERLRRALAAMDEWEPVRQLEYLIRLGVKNREARFTKDFGGEAEPEPESLPKLALPAAEDASLIRLLYMLRHADDICLDGPTARSITKQPRLAGLIRILNGAVAAGLAERTSAKELTESDRDFVFGVRLTAEGRRLLDRALCLGEPRAPAAQ